MDADGGQPGGAMVAGWSKDTNSKWKDDELSDTREEEQDGDDDNMVVEHRDTRWTRAMDPVPYADTVGRRWRRAGS